MSSCISYCITVTRIQSHYYISVRWRNCFYHFAYMSKNDKQFEALEKAMKILQINEKDGLHVEAKWFNH